MRNQRDDKVGGSRLGEQTRRVAARCRTEVRRLRQPSRGIMHWAPALQPHARSRIRALIDLSPLHVARQRQNDAYTTARLLVRPSLPTDAPELVALVDEVVLRQHDWGPGDVENLRERVATSRDYNQSIICARATGRVVGAIGVETENQKPGECDLGLWLGPGFRWGGYAYEACKETIDRLHQNGYTVVHAATRSDNRAVIKLYERLGFEVVGHESKPLTNGGDASFILADHVAPERQYRLHPDPVVPDNEPLDGVDPGKPSSNAAKAYRASLMLNDLTLRDSVIDDLATFYKLTAEEAVRRCVHWEEWSHEEWSSRERDTPEGSAEFFRTVQSWSFDLLWYAYLQALGTTPPVSVVIAETLGDIPTGAAHLDFGSGVGVTAQMMSGLGFTTEMADLSTSLLDFARFRIERRGESIPSIDLSHDTLGTDRYDVITAVDTLAHIPNLPEVLQTLHRALKPNGVLFTNFDVREQTPENHSFLYSDDLPLLRLIRRAGFNAEQTLEYGGIVRYRKVDTDTWAHRARTARDMVALGPPRRLYRWIRNVIK